MLEEVPTIVQRSRESCLLDKTCEGYIPHNTIGSNEKKKDDASLRVRCVNPRKKKACYVWQKQNDWKVSVHSFEKKSREKMRGPVRDVTGVALANYKEDNKKKTAFPSNRPRFLIFVVSLYIYSGTLVYNRTKRRRN